MAVVDTEEYLVFLTVYSRSIGPVLCDSGRSIMLNSQINNYEMSDTWSLSHPVYRGNIIESEMYCDAENMLRNILSHLLLLERSFQYKCFDLLTLNQCMFICSWLTRWNEKVIYVPNLSDKCMIKFYSSVDRIINTDCLILLKIYGKKETRSSCR